MGRAAELDDFVEPLGAAVVRIGNGGARGGHRIERAQVDVRQLALELVCI